MARRRKKGPEFEDVFVLVADRDGTCGSCGVAYGRGELIRPAGDEGVHCLKCAGLDDLMYVPPGDPALTRRARRYSGRQAAILRRDPSWRGRWARTGSLAEPAAVERAQAECQKDARSRARSKVWRDERRAVSRERYLGRFAELIAQMYPGCPPVDAQAIAARASEGSNTALITPGLRPRKVNPRVVERTVAEHVRHAHTPFDSLVAGGASRGDAAAEVAEAVAEIVARWAVGGTRPVPDRRRGP